jgi:thioredoxin 1
VSIIDLTEKNFDEKVAAGGIVLVECRAGWCAACNSFVPIFERVAANFPDHTFAKIDAQAEHGLIDKLGVELIPSLLLYRDGILLFEQPGYYEEEQLNEIVYQAGRLDMDLVRADIAEEEQARRMELH